VSNLKDIVIVGAGGLGREVLAVIATCNAARKEWNVLGFLDSDRNLVGSKFGGVPVFGDDDWIHSNSVDSVWFVCAIGNPKIRSQIVERFSVRDCKFASIVHPDVRIPHSVRIGAGTVVMAGTQFTTDVNIGSHVVVYLNCAITHDVEIGSFCTIASACNLSGGAVLETGVQLGVGTNILPRRRIGAWSIIGAGGVVTDDIPACSIAVGVPCRVIKND
jgi:sugar O-acyltransferase (sialic acid O-acetyltransferase NeuD family)